MKEFQQADVWLMNLHIHTLIDPIDNGAVVLSFLGAAGMGSLPLMGVPTSLRTILRQTHPRRHPGTPFLFVWVPETLLLGC